VAYSSRQMGQTDGHTRKRKNHILQMVCRVEPPAAWFLQHCWLTACIHDAVKKVKVANTRLQSVGFRSRSQFLAGNLSYKPGGRLPLLSARPAVTLATLKRAATTLTAWWTEARWVWAVCLLRLIPDSIATAIWTRALLHLSPAR